MGGQLYVPEYRGSHKDVFAIPPLDIAVWCLSPLFALGVATHL